jgi:predicted O-methyltransferase YrrM
MILEVGSFEGRSTVYLVEQIRKHSNAPIEIHCIDTWQGGAEHAGIDFDSVEGRYDRNMKKLVDSTFDLTICKRKGLSSVSLAEYFLHCTLFDFIYIDGSHVPSDVFLDAALAFKLLRVGGVLIFDDYEFGDEESSDSPFTHPHIAIDAFISTYANKLSYLPLTADVDGVRVDLRKQANLYQMYLVKAAD